MVLRHQDVKVEEIPCADPEARSYSLVEEKMSSYD
jgi:hypothetical protein